MTVGQLLPQRDGRLRKVVATMVLRAKDGTRTGLEDEDCLI